MKRRFRLLKDFPEAGLEKGHLITIETKNITFRQEITYDPATKPDLWEEVKEDTLKNKKYKLIKTYPGSPKTIGLQIRQNGPFWQSDFAIESVEHFHIDTKFNPQDYPEFWQEVVEKDYEILSVSKNKHIFKIENGYSYLLQTKDYDYIHSVKRLSDGEIFTIGDSVNYTDSNLNFDSETGNYCLITKFSIHNDNIYVNRHYEGSPELNINQWNKRQKKLPLFKTEDGVDIFEYNDFWYLTKELKLKHWKPEVMASFEVNKVYLQDKIKFSTKEKAEEYVYQHKPRFSFKDIELAWKKHSEEIPITPSLYHLINSLEKHCL